MSEISYFQRYSQKENHITNSLLLMMRTLYRSHPQKLQIVLEGILTEADWEKFDLHVGPVFEQQVGSSSSVPDAIISQESFNLVIEVKPGDHWNEPQLLRHLKSASDYGYDNTLLLLISTDASPVFKKPLLKAADARNVSLVSTTFEKIIGVIDREEVVAAHETDLRDIVDDFKDVLWEADLLEDPYTMFAFGCSRTLDWNLENNIYYDHASRPSKANVLTGFYARKKIHALGQVSATVVGNPKVSLEVEVEHEEKSDEELINLVKKASKGLGLSKTDEPLRWYIYDKLHKTDFRKSTPYGYFQGVWFYLEDFVDENIDPKDIEEMAHNLRGKTFENDRGYAD